MKLGLISSAWLGSPVGTAEGIRLTKEIGFETIDIFADPMDIDIRERRLIKDTCREVGIPVVASVCCALGIADFNAPVRRFHVQRADVYKRQVRDRMEFGVQLVQVIAEALQLHAQGRAAGQ